MARGVNRVTLLGNLGADPECKYLPNGNAVANATIATSESWKDKQTGQQHERTEWTRVVFYGRLAEVVSEYARKGSKLYIEGRLSTREYEKDGIKRYVTEVVVDMRGTMQLLDGAPQGGQQRTQRPQQRQRNDLPPNPPPQQSMPDYDSFDDDIPF